MSTSPDAHGTGLSAKSLDSMRYESLSDHSSEAAGILREYMPSNAKVLDVGCGAGSVTLIANRDKNNQVFGVEPDPVRAGVAQSRGVNATCGFLTAEYIAAHGPFDAVLFADVLEHLANPSEMLALAHSALKPGGCLLVSVPNAVHWTMRWDYFFGTFEYSPSGIHDATHLRWFTEKIVVRLIESSGFSVDRVKQSAGAALPEYFVWRPWSWMKFTHRSRLLKVLVKCFPRLFGAQHVLLAHKR